MSDHALKIQKRKGMTQDQSVCVITASVTFFIGITFHIEADYHSLFAVLDSKYLDELLPSSNHATH